MTATFADQLGWVPKSPNLIATLERAFVYAEEQGHRQVSVEHLLLALTEDGDALALFRAMRIDVDRMRDEVAGFISRQNDRVPLDQEVSPRPADELVRILEYATAAAQQSQRQRIDGAIVLAALIGEGRSPAAELLKSQGMTFEETIRVLPGVSEAQSQPSPAPAARRIGQRPAPAVQERARGADGVVHNGAASEAAGRQAPPIPPWREPPKAGSDVAYERAPVPPQPAPAPVRTGARPAPQAPAPARAPSSFPAEGNMARQGLPEVYPPQPMGPPPRVGTRAPAPPPQGAPRGRSDYATDGVPPSARVRTPVPPPPAAAARPAPAPVQTGPVGRTQGRRPGRPPGVDTGTLVENIPRRMRVAMPETVEIRIARNSLESLSEGMQGRGAPVQHAVLVTRAMSVRLRAPEGNFKIESSSPETQWIENTLGLLQDDYAVWRFTVTPERRGRSRLQLVVSARTVGVDGLTAETAFPDQIVDVSVGINLGRAMKRAAVWTTLVVLSSALGAFFEAASRMVHHLIGL